MATKKGCHSVPVNPDLLLNSKAPSDSIQSGPSESGKAEVHPGVILDGRLCLFHQEHRWLALSDLHFGYEITRRLQGGLMPLWGMHTVRERLLALVRSYAPKRVILVGDIVDGRGSSDEALRFFDKLEDFGPDLICIAGNHDRGEIRNKAEFVDSWREGEFFFHHGHLSPPPEGGDALIEITGHHHPAISLHDGAGLRLKLPALVQEPKREEGRERWILPAFSPWAGGGNFRRNARNPKPRIWACHPSRVFPWDS